MFSYSTKRLAIKLSYHRGSRPINPTLPTIRSATGWPGSSVPQDLIDQKEKNQLSFIDIANHIGRSETWTAGLFYGKNEPTSTDLEKLSELFKLPAQSINDPTPPRSTISLDSSPSLSSVIEEILRLPTSEDQIVSAYGWIKTIRKQKNVSFVELIDGSTPQHLQVVIGPKDSEELETGCAIRVTGKLVSSRGDRQAKELKASSVSLIGACSALEYPSKRKLTVRLSCERSLIYASVLNRSAPSCEYGRPCSTKHLHPCRPIISSALKHQSSPSTIAKVPEKCFLSNLTANPIDLQRYCLTQHLNQTTLMTNTSLAARLSLPFLLNYIWKLCRLV
ncbi:hypothetical protein PSHT_09274, partial [Puccinia striiformis]